MTFPPPFAEDLVLDVPLEAAPDLTIDAGLAASYLAISGDQLPLCLSSRLSEDVTGRKGRLANPALVLSVAIGQSTVATRRVIANLYYRDVALARQLFVGETLRTIVTPVAAEWTRSGTDRAKVLLDIAVTAVEHGDEIAHFQRLALIPVAEPRRLVERPVAPQSAAPALESFRATVPDWNGTRFPGRFGLPVGVPVTDQLSDTVSSARELVRLTLNGAAAHRDGRRGIDGRRLAYGGHTVALAQASLSRTVEGLMTVLAWRSCDHLAPVFEEDLLETTVTIEEVLPIESGRAVVDARITVNAVRPVGDIPVLDWRPVLLVAHDGTV